MDALLAAIEQSYLPTILRSSRWGYAALNATHIAGIALLVGAIVPLNLRLFGFWPTIARRDLARVLAPTAATGLMIAAASGLMLFSVRATEYPGLWLFWGKLSVVALGGASAIIAHVRYGRWLDATERANLFGVALTSMTCWIAALAAGRLIAFVQ